MIRSNRSKHILLALCTAAAVACAPHPEDTVVGQPRDDVGPEATMADPTGEQPATADADFVHQIMRHAQTTVELGQLAGERGQMREVRELAQAMAADYRRARLELQKVAAAARVDPPPPEEHAPEIARRREELERRAGAEFDREYVRLIIEQHEAAVPRIAEVAERAEHDDVRQWAAAALPIWRQYLERARQLEVAFEVRPLT